MKNKEVTLFIVEDDDVDFLTIKRSLARRAIANPVVRAKDGQEALELLERGDVTSPFIILLDIQMPRMNGLEFLNKLRIHKDFSQSVVFMLTTSTNENDIVASYENHTAGYFTKEESGDGVVEVVDVLQGYWKIAYLPE